jgi:hypothetical protein
MVSCYGSSMATFAHPVGRPFFFTTSVNEVGITLETFLKEYQCELIEGLWTITVSGDLTFEQTLIYSKTFSTNTTPGPEGHEYNDEPKDHVLLTKEIVNGVLTHDLLNTIQSVCTSAEKIEFFQLRVQSAVLYKKSNRCEDAKAWTEKILDHRTNDRTEAWYSFGIGKFLDPILQRRAVLKKQLKSINKETDRDIYSSTNAMQTSLKLIVNTLYGVVASPFFRINNLVVSNNITGRARSNMWLMSRALSILQSIVDGGFFELERVNRLRTEVSYFRKPGMSLLSNLKGLARSRYVEQVPLLLADWVDEKKCDHISNIPPYRLESLITEHLKCFWGTYNIDINFKIEIKDSHTALATAYIAKADNASLLLNGKIMYKTRDISIKPGSDQKIPLWMALTKILEDKPDDYIPEDRIYVQSQPISFKEHIMNVKRDPTYNLLPGRFVDRERKYIVKPSGFHLKNAAQLKRILAYGRKGVSLEVTHPFAKNVNCRECAAIMIAEGSRSRKHKCVHEGGKVKK